MTITDPDPGVVTPPRPAQFGLDVQEHVELAKFTLVIRGMSDEAASALAAELQERIRSELTRLRYPWDALYEWEVRETEVWKGSRKSRIELRLTHRKTKGVRERIRRGVQTVLISISLVSVDVENIETNIRYVTETVEQFYREQERDVEIQELRFSRSSLVA